MAFYLVLEETNFNLFFFFQIDFIASVAVRSKSSVDIDNFLAFRLFLMILIGVSFAVRGVIVW